jgi:hypothetical protein
MDLLARRQVPMVVGCGPPAREATKGALGNGSHADKQDQQRLQKNSRSTMSQLLNWPALAERLGTTRRRRGFTAALSRVPPEVEPFFHGVRFAVIGPQGFVLRWRGSCGLVVAGSAAAGAGHDLRRLGLG